MPARSGAGLSSPLLRRDRPLRVRSGTPAPGRPGRRRAALLGLLLVVLVSVVVGAVGWGGTAPAEDRTAPEQDRSVTSASDPSIAFLGDSVTEGIGAPADQGYAWLTAELLGWRVALVDGVSGSGYLTPGWDRPMPERVQRLVAARPDVVVVAGGTNDGFRGHGAEEVRPAADALLGELRHGLPDAEIVVLGPFPTTADPTTTAEDEIEAALREAARQVDAEFVDTRTMIDSALGGPDRWQRYLSVDGVHPDPEGHAALADALAERLVDVTGD